MLFFHPCLVPMSFHCLKMNSIVQNQVMLPLQGEEALTQLRAHKLEQGFLCEILLSLVFFWFGPVPILHQVYS